MTNRERIYAILEGNKPDRIPFMPFSEFVPCGSYERELRNRGMSFITHYIPVWKEIPNVSWSKNTANGWKKQSTILRR